MGILDLFKNFFTCARTDNKNNIHNSINKTTNDNYPNIDYSMSIFLNWANGKKIGESLTDYPQYIKYECNINNPIDFHKKMINDGYLCTPEIDSLLTFYKVTELKQILSKNNLPTTGKKNILIQRIIDNVPKDTLEKIKNLFKGYVLSEKGRFFIDKNNDYIEIHKNSNWMISLDEYTNKKKQLQFDAHFYDIAWGIFNDRNLQYTHEQNWGLVRNNIFNMSELLNKENKPAQSLLFLLSVLYYDLSGLMNNNILCNFEDIVLAPGIISRILKLKKYYSEDIINNCPFLNQLPYSYFTIETFKLMLHELLESGDIDLNKYKKYAKTTKHNI